MPPWEHGFGESNQNCRSGVLGIKTTELLGKAIQGQQTHIDIQNTINRPLVALMKKEKEECFEQTKFAIVSRFTPRQSRFISLASEKGASSWLSTLPLQHYGFAFNKQEFNDAIALRYNFEIPDRSIICV